LIDLFYDDDAYVFARQQATETVIIAINRAGQEKKVTAPVGSIGVRDGSELRALIGSGSPVRVTNGEATFIIPGRTAVAYK